MADLEFDWADSLKGGDFKVNGPARSYLHRQVWWLRRITVNGKLDTPAVLRYLADIAKKADDG